VLCPDLPKAVRTEEPLEVLRGNKVQLFNKTQDPNDFLSLLATERIEKLLDGAVASLGPIEADFAHFGRLTQR
jgi:hypothetical protein